MKYSYRKAMVLAAVYFWTTGTASSQGTYEILHDSLTASGWFGGDNRACCGPRHVGAAQEVFVDTSIILDSFSFYFTTMFDYAENPDGFGHEVTLTLNIRDAQGSILQTEQVVVDSTFAGGWVTWSGINMPVNANTMLIFSAYLVGAYDVNQYFTGHGCDLYALYSPGAKYIKEGMSDADMELWTDWSQHSWDALFWLVGTIVAVAVEVDPPIPSTFTLSHNFPNPFNPQTTLVIGLPAESYVSLRIFDLLGREVEALHEGALSVGFHRRTWDASAVPSGTYIAQLNSPGGTAIRKLMLVK